MSTMAKSLVTVIVTTTFVAVLGYFFGFAMLLTHVASEIFWYGLLFGGTNILALSVLWFLGREKTVQEPKAVTNSAAPIAPAA